MDPIANMFTQLKNAGCTGKEKTKINYSKINLAILTILKNKGYIKDFKEETIENQKFPILMVTFAYKENKKMPFNDLRRVSRPGRRVYIGANKINQHLRGKEDILISTSRGVMAGSEARKKGLGGEIIGEVV